MSDGLWDRLCAMPRPHKVVEFPRRDSNGELIKNAEIAIWVLTQGEQEEAAARAEERTRTLLTNPKAKDAKPLSTRDILDSDVYRNAAADELLVRCLRTKDDLKQLVPTAAHLRQFFTVDEVGMLCQLYYGVQGDLGPLISTMTEVEMEALLDELEKDGRRFPLDSLSRELLRELLIFSVCRRSSSSMGTSSSGSPQDASTSEPSNASDSEEVEGTSSEK